MKLCGGFLKSVLVSALILTALAWAAGAGKSITVKGYVLDSACAFTKNLEKPISPDCARACAKAGSPLVILADDGTVYSPKLPTPRLRVGRMKN